MKLYGKRMLVGTCCLVAVFCLYGFVAPIHTSRYWQAATLWRMFLNDPRYPNHASFRVGYAVVGLGCLVLAGILVAKK